MKKVIMTLTVMFITFNAWAMSYEQAQREALFLTDKMAYELNLTDEQYDAAYEINLDYLMGVTGRNNVFGTYWERRNLDLSYILLDWQYRAFCAAQYFYRPLYWDAGYWHFGIYARYPRTHFYFSRPTVYVSYRGNHSWHSNGGNSYWRNHRQTFNHGGTHVGMRDKHLGGNNGGKNHGNMHIGNNNHQPNTRPNTNGNRHDNNYNNSRNRHNGNRPNNNGNRNHDSSTRVTVNNGNRPNNNGNHTPSNNNEGRGMSTGNNSNGNRFGGARHNNSNSSSTNSSSSRQSHFGGSSTRSSGSNSNFGDASRKSNSGSSNNRNNGGGHFGGDRH